MQDYLIESLSRFHARTRQKGWRDSEEGGGEGKARLYKNNQKRGTLPVRPMTSLVGRATTAALASTLHPKLKNLATPSNIIATTPRL